MSTFTSYDISHITHRLAQPHLIPAKPFIYAGHHAFHVELLDVMHHVTGSPVLGEWADRWRPHNGSPPKQP